MKKYILVFILAVSCTFSQWKTSTWDDELPIIGLQFEGDTVVMSNYYGKLKYSTNNSSSFKEKIIPTDNNFYTRDLIFFDSVLVVNFPNSEYYFKYSTDFGDTWNTSEHDLPEYLQIEKMTVFKNRIYGISDNLLFYSDDIGKSFKILKKLDMNTFKNIEIFQNEMILYCSKDIYKLNETGTDLEVFNLNLPNDDILKYFENINTFKVFDDIIILGLNGYQTKVFYYSTDEGNTWTKCDSSPFIYDSFNLTKYKEQFYISNNENLFVSNDTCKSWEVINTPFPLHKTIYFVNNNDNLYSVVGNEIYVFDGNEWSKWYGKENYGSLQQFKYIDNFLYAASYSNPGYSSFNERLFRSSDMGKSWEPAIIGLDSIREYKFIGDIIVATYNDYDYLISTDKGSSWKELGVDKVSFRDIRAYEKNIIVTNNIGENYLSTDNGKSWTNINGQLPFQITKKPTIEMYDKKLLIKHNGSLYYSEDLGKSWNDISEGLPVIPLYPDMYIDDFLIIISFLNEIYISYDFGESWTVLSNNFPDDFYGVKIKKYDKGLFLALYIHYGSQLYFSKDNGFTWKNIIKEYDYNLYITDFEILDSKIIIGNSFFRPMFGVQGKIIYADLNIVSVENSDEPTDYITVYPNPASDYIEISMSNNGLQPFVNSNEIGIYDVVGEKVISTEDTERSRSAEVGIGSSFSGYFDYAQQPLRIDISHLPRGVYFVRIGDRIEKFVKR